MTGKVDSIRRQVEFEPRVRQGHRRRKALTNGILTLEPEDSAGITTQSHFFLRAQHTVAHLASNLTRFDDEAAGKRHTWRYVRIQSSLLYVRGPTHHVDQLVAAGIHPAQSQPIRIRMPNRFHDSGHDDSLESFANRDNAIDRNRLHAQSIRQFGGGPLNTWRQRPEPVDGDVHQSNCSRKAISPSYNRRMSGTRYLSIAIRPGPIPNAYPVYFSSS